MVHVQSGVSETLHAILFGLQRAQNRRITYVAMADALGVSQRAFSEWMRGAREPAAMEALLRMLAMLPNEDVTHVLDVWRAQSAAPPKKESPAAMATKRSKKILKSTSKTTHPIRDRENKT